MKTSFFFLFGTYQEPSMAVFAENENIASPGMVEFRGIFDGSDEAGYILDRYGNASISEFVCEMERTISFRKQYPGREDVIVVDANFIREKGYYAGRWKSFTNNKQVAWGPVKLLVVPTTLDLFQYTGSAEALFAMLETRDGRGELFPVGA